MVVIGVVVAVAVVGVVAIGVVVVVAVVGVVVLSVEVAVPAEKRTFATIRVNFVEVDTNNK